MVSGRSFFSKSLELFVYLNPRTLPKLTFCFWLFSTQEIWDNQCLAWRQSIPCAQRSFMLSGDRSSQTWPLLTWSPLLSCRGRAESLRPLQQVPWVRISRPCTHDHSQQHPSSGGSPLHLLYVLLTFVHRTLSLSYLLSLYIYLVPSAPPFGPPIYFFLPF